MKTILSRLSGFILPILLINNALNGQNDKSFLKPPMLITNLRSNPEYAPESRRHTGIPSIAATGNRLWVIWYTGKTPAEDLNNYVVLSTSGDGGKTWEETLVIDPDGPGPVRAFDPEVWIDPDGRLWIFWAQAIDNDEAKWMDGKCSGVWAVTTMEKDSVSPKWSEPRRLTEGVMMCKPTVVSSGEWVLPVSTWKVEGSSKAVVSLDHGKSFQLRGSATILPEEIRDGDENMLIEKKDGTWWMVIRTRNGMGESFSFDRGKTWTPFIPSKIQHAKSRFFIRRLSSGNILLVKHGPIDVKTGRSHLMAFISKDDGFTWSNGLLLDERQGVSYPDGQQASDGTIYVTYDFDRKGVQNILMTSFTEDDILEGTDKKIYEVYTRRIIVSKGGPK